jgi:hypothetical protein
MRNVEMLSDDIPFGHFQKKSANVSLLGYGLDKRREKLTS